MDVVDFVKRNAPSFMASMVISFPACLWFVNQFVYTPKVEAIEIVKNDLQTRFDNLEAKNTASEQKFQNLGDKKDTLTSNLHKSNSELIVNHYNLQNLTNKINELNNDKNILNSKLVQVYAEKNRLDSQLKDFQENRQLLDKIANLEEKKVKARNGDGVKTVFGNRTVQEIRADNEVNAREIQAQILSLQDKLKVACKN
jgi:hypothetical protein